MVVPGSSIIALHYDIGTKVIQWCGLFDQLAIYDNGEFALFTTHL